MKRKIYVSRNYMKGNKLGQGKYTELFKEVEKNNQNCVKYWEIN